MMLTSPRSQEQTPLERISTQGHSSYFSLEPHSSASNSVTCPEIQNPFNQHLSSKPTLSLNVSLTRNHIPSILSGDVATRRGITLKKSSYDLANNNDNLPNSATKSATEMLKTPVSSHSNDGKFHKDVFKPRSPSLPILPFPTLNKSHNAEIPSKFNRISVQSLANIIISNPVIEERRFLIIDTRCYTDFCFSRIKDSVNFCLPTTLLKRQTFTLDRTINRLPLDQIPWFKDVTKSIIIYDAATSHPNRCSLELEYICKKFISSNWKGDLFYVGGGYNLFESFVLGEGLQNQVLHKGVPQNPNIIQGNKFNKDTFTSKIQTNNIKSRSQPTSPLPGLGLRLILPAITPGSETLYCNQLVHNLKQNSGCKSFDVSDDDETFRIKLDDISLPPLNPSKIPHWMMRVCDENKGPIILAKNFNELEKLEEERLKMALRHSQNSNSQLLLNSSNHHCKNSKCLDSHLTITSGVEQGTKNRYKNIIPYDHTRVKIQQINSGEDDYFNGNYISLNGVKRKCIATQGPLPETLESFWKVIIEQNIKCIMNLTQENEGGYIKCHKYWVPGKYGRVILKVLEERKEILNDYTKSEVIIRKFHLTLVDNNDHVMITHTVSQIHFSLWSDFGIPMSPRDILSLCELKNEMVKGYEEIPVVVHCSAGCGRTGTFCTVDTILELLTQQKVKNLPLNEGLSQLIKTSLNDNYFSFSSPQTKTNESSDTFNVDPNDIIYYTINEFRRQRISMVQTLRQYILCYNCILLWMRTSPTWLNANV